MSLLIPIDDEFRRAKRNTLFFSSLVVALAIGQPNATTSSGCPAITSSLLQSNLEYCQWQVGGLLWLAAAFAAIGYIRSAREVRMKASEALLGDQLEEAAAAFSGLKQKADAQASAIRKIWSGPIQKFSSFDERIKDSEAKFNAFNAQLEEFKDTLARIRWDDDGQPRVGMKRMQLKTTYDELTTSLFTVTNSFFEYLARELPGKDDTDLREFPDDFTKHLSEVAAEGERLTKWAERYKGAQTWWHYCYDHGAVALLIVAASVAEFVMLRAS